MHYLNRHRALITNAFICIFALFKQSYCFYAFFIIVICFIAMASFFIFMREMINKIYDNCNLETVMKTLMKISKERFIIIKISKIPFNRLLSVVSVLSVPFRPYNYFFKWVKIKVIIFQYVNILKYSPYRKYNLKYN